MEKGPKPLERLKNMVTAGNLWLYVLSLIKANGRMYAYTLDDEIEGEFLFRPSKVMIYIVLHKLEEERMISSEFEERRKYYKLTEKGSKTLANAKSYFKVLGERL